MIYIFILLIIAIILEITRKREKVKEHIKIAGSMTIGDRQVQEDNYNFIEKEQGIMAVLADGSGKSFGGKIASKIAIDSFIEVFKEYNAFDNPQYFFKKSFNFANREILNTLEDERYGHASVGAVLVRNGYLYYSVIGNVEVAIFRRGDIIKLSIGHTLDVLAKESFKVGKISKQSAIKMLENKRLYNYIGQEEFLEVEIFDTPIKLEENDIIILMSDGVYENISYKKIEEILKKEINNQAKAFEIIENINTSNIENKDNASILLIDTK